MRKILFILYLTLVIVMPGVEGEAKQKTFDAYLCPVDKIIFDDGDSFTCANEDIRILGVDTPEIRHPAHGISRSQRYGRQAAAFTKKLLKEAKRIIIIRYKKDHYGRTLAHVLVDGELIAVKIIKAGLGYETISRHGDSGFPEFALVIKEAFHLAPPLRFEDPYLWRRKHQR